MDDELKIYAGAMLLLGGSLLTFARRYKNSDPSAGVGVAGWTIFIILMMW